MRAVFESVERVARPPIVVDCAALPERLVRARSRAPPEYGTMEQMMLFILRPGQPEDLPRLAAIETEALACFEGHEAWESFAAHPADPQAFRGAMAEGRVLVAEHPTEGVIGFAVRSILDGQAHLYEMDVHPAHGRKGVGAALLERTLALAAQAGYRSITLTTLRDVPWNAPFYARHGFRIVPPEEDTPGLAALRKQEAAAGFPMHLRVAMRRELP